MFNLDISCVSNGPRTAYEGIITVEHHFGNTAVAYWRILYVANERILFVTLSREEIQLGCKTNGL